MLPPPPSGSKRAVGGCRFRTERYSWVTWRSRRVSHPASETQPSSGRSPVPPSIVASTTSRVKTKRRTKAGCRLVHSSVHQTDRK